MESYHSIGKKSFFGLFNDRPVIGRWKFLILKFIFVKIEIMTFDTHRHFSAIISLYKYTQRHFSEGCLFSSEKNLWRGVSEANKKLFSKKLFSEKKNWFCQSNLEEQRKSYVNPSHKYTKQNYRLEDSVCIFMFIKQ